MTSIERTAYPRFAKLTSARMLHVSFTPQPDEIEWARGHTNSPQALLAVLLALKCHQKMARFPAAGEVPDEVGDHVRRHLDPLRALYGPHLKNGMQEWEIVAARHILQSKPPEGPRLHFALYLRGGGRTSR